VKVLRRQPLFIVLKVSVIKNIGFENNFKNKNRFEKILLPNEVVKVYYQTMYAY